ncbi:uncharacterized protein LOC125842768 [Solanum stenotomum]|uniref:uncharacterized protein LOC125842768 n=1 Tax=Solanum stenotomum TaxID=172797 RepID=UPI0020D1991B|nr:uncharacterized protein LOC125842768 [Solanum stenotomum]
MEDSILKQKTQLHWFKEGDANTKYFHSLIRGRRRRLFIHTIIREDGERIHRVDNIADAACAHFQNIFTGEDKVINEDAINCIPRMVSQEHNNTLTAMPNLEDLKEVVFSMNPNSAAGPDGMNGLFFQKCWHIIKHDLLGVIHAFFCGQMIPKYFSHSCIVLLPKVTNPNKLTEFRPISLSNFTSKIISKLSGFIKGRSISENIMLAQEIIHQIRKPNIGSNVIIKLDMAKAYDRVSWSYICLVLRKMGFHEIFIDMVWRIMANNWYSIIVNGKRHGFFHFTRGLKQGDPLSSTLFIFGAEVLSRSLNRLHSNPDYHGFVMEPKGPQVNHLSFADDIILFSSGRQKTLKLIMQTLNLYEETSGQLVNTDKSHFMVHPNAFNNTRDRIKMITGFRQKEGPITYLGCPLFVGRPRIIYFSDLINKVLCRVTGESLTWKHMMHNKHKIEEHIHWKLNSGNCSFWWDNWLGMGPLAYQSTGSNRFNQITVADFWLEGRWNLNMLLQQAPNSQLANILATELHIQQGIPDQAVWKPNSDGTFSCSSAWNVIREKRNKTKFNSFIWHKSIPFKSSFILWRALRGKLPTNEKLTSFGNEAANCFCCCNRPGLDTIENTFNNGQFATNVWKSFAAPAGIITDHSSLPQLITQWWSAKASNEAHRLLLHATPIFICWNLWKNRCASRHGGKQSNISRVKYAIYKDNYKLMTTCFPHIKWPSRWWDLIQLGEKCTHDTKVTVVKWIKPPDGWVKINTDGSALGNPGKIGAGGIIRDQSGKMLLAFATPLGEGSNNQAEVAATLFGMTWSLQLGYRNVILEVDSQLLVDCIENKTNPHWGINTQLLKLQALTRQANEFKCKHTFREANFVADSLSKYSHKITSPQIYLGIHQLPKETRAYYQLDILEMANFRRRKIKKIKEPP